MRIRDLFTPQARTAFPDEPLADAARTMSREHIGALVIVDRDDPSHRPVGILTDRDIVRGQLRRSADLYCLTVADVMTPDPLVLSADLEAADAIEALNTRAVRRAPVVGPSDASLGIVTIDDLLPAVAQDLEALASLMATQPHREARRRS